MDSVNSNAAREGSDGSNCDRVFILFDIFHCSNCDDELQEHRIVYGEIIENIDQIREELNGMRQRLKKLLLRNCSTEFPPMESITSNVLHTSSGVIDDRVRGSDVNDTEIKNKEDDFRKQTSRSEDKAKDTDNHKKNEIRKQRSMSEDKDKETTDHKKESITSNVPRVSSGVIDNHVHGSFLNDTEIKNKEDVIGKQKSRSGDKEKETAHPQKDDFRKQKSRSEDKAKDTDNHKKNAIRKQRSMSEDKDKETADHKKELITPNDSYEWSGVIDKRVHSSVPKDTELKHQETSTYKQNTRLGRQRLQRKEDIWPGSEVIRYGGDGSVMETEIKTDNKTRPRRQRLERGSDVSGDGVSGSVLKDADIKLKDIQDDDIPNPWSNSNLEDKETIDDNKFQDYVPHPVSTSEDESEETVDDNKETVDSIPSNDGFEVIGEDVPEIKSKDTSSHGQKPRPRRQRLQRKGKVWPGYAVIGDGVHGSILMEIEIKHASSCNQKTGQRRQRLQRKV